MKKILIFNQFYTSLDEAGIARFNLFAPYWQEEGVATEVIAGMVNYQSGVKKQSCRGRIFAREEDGSVLVKRVFNFSLGYRSFIGRVISYLSFLFFSFLAGLFSASADIIIASSPPIFIGLTAYLISALKRKPFILEVRDLWPDEVIEFGIIKNKWLIRFSYAIESFLYRKAKLIIVNSPGLKEFLTQTKSIVPEKIGVVPNPVELRLFHSEEAEAIRKKFGWQNKFIVLYSGAHSFVYDFNPILETAKSINGKMNILFVFIGDGKQKPALIEKVNKEQIKNVIFLDPVPKEKIGGFISAADVCIASLKDLRLLKYVYSSKVFDYMAAKKPIVLAMEGVTADLICREAKCGVCIKSGNAQEFKSAIITLHNHSFNLKELGERGFEFVEKNFTAEKLAKEYLNLLKFNIKEVRPPKIK